VYYSICLKIVVSMLWGDGLSVGLCTEFECQIREGESGSCICMLELYIVDKIKKGISIFLRLFIDDSAVSLTKLNIEVSNEFIHQLLCTGWVRTWWCSWVCIRICHEGCGGHKQMGVCWNWCIWYVLCSKCRPVWPVSERWQIIGICHCTCMYWYYLCEF